MEAQTISLEITCPADKAYDYIRDPRNFPHWAPGFCQSISEQEGRWLAETSLGPVEIRFVASNPFGVLDHVVKVGDGPEMLNPMRIVPNGPGSTILFTVFRRAGMSSLQFAEDQGLVLKDLEALKQTLESR